MAAPTPPRSHGGPPAGGQGDRTSESPSASHPLDEASLDEIRVAHAQLAGWVNGLLLAEATSGTSLTIERTVTDSPDRA